MTRRMLLASIAGALGMTRLAKTAHAQQTITNHQPVPGYPQILKVGEAFELNDVYYITDWWIDGRRITTCKEQVIGYEPSLGGIPFHVLRDVSVRYGGHQ